jgi:Fe2+ transport system protein FeoA
MLPTDRTPGLDRALAGLGRGEPAVVAEVTEPGALGDRLLEMGLTPGAPIEIVRLAPFGDPLQIRVRGYLLAIRRAQAEQVLVRPR